MPVWSALTEALALCFVALAGPDFFTRPAHAVNARPSVHRLNVVPCAAFQSAAWWAKVAAG